MNNFGKRYVPKDGYIKKGRSQTDSMNDEEIIKVLQQFKH